MAPTAAAAAVDADANCSICGLGHAASDCPNDSDEGPTAAAPAKREFEVESIIDKKGTGKGNVKYLVRWKGFGTSEVRRHRHCQYVCSRRVR